MDWCARGPEFRLSVGETRAVLYYLAAEVQTLHSCWVVQRSINLESIAYDGRRACLCDFRFARSFARGKLVIYKQLHKLFRYSAPEVWYHIPVEGPSIDVWALGVCAYRLATGEFPFSGFAQQEVFDKIHHQRRPHFPSPFPSHRLKRLLRSMLILDHSARISAGEILMHPFFMERLPSVHGFNLSSSYPRRMRPSASPSPHRRSSFSLATSPFLPPPTTDTQRIAQYIAQTETTTETTTTSETTDTSSNPTAFHPQMKTAAPSASGFASAATTTTAEDLTDTDPAAPSLHWQRASISRPLNELVWSPALPPLFFGAADPPFEFESSFSSFPSTIMHELSSTDSSYS